ncbi:MAG: carboxypeptidase-like regulatory domain-containing protein [candidate division Zixibacteria bacterium]|nr:carboxypeptidase-like regulatory domain-containing protein [candidate division Zixibacteria bacterium]
MNAWSRRRRVILMLLAATVCAALSAYAGVTGKISGVVSDAESDEPLVGATVRVLGTDLVATTDDEGEYFIINVPSGKYDISVTHVGFELITKRMFGCCSISPPRLISPFVRWRCSWIRRWWCTLRNRRSSAT